MNEAQRLVKANADHKAAMDEVRRLNIEAEAAISAANAALGKAYAEMNAAQAAADRLLPTCIMHSTSWRNGKQEKILQFVVKRTAKTVFVKSAGQTDDSARQFRIGKSGRWDQYPRGSTLAHVYYWIEFPDDTSAHDLG